MTARRCKKHIMLAFTALLVLIPLIAFEGGNIPVAHADYSVTVTPSQQYQTIQGWGTSLAWWANIIGGWSNSQRTALADALYNPTTGIGLNLARYNFGADGPGNTCESQMKAGRSVPSFEPTQGTYNWSADANQLWFAQAAKARGADVFEGFVNSAPAWMLLNSCTAGGPSGAENLNTAHYNDFASYIATITQHFNQKFGITFQTVDPFNEPSHTWWSSSGTQEGMRVTPASQSTIIPLVGAALVQNKASDYSSISSPDDNRVNESINDFNAYSSTAKSYLTQWNTHSYGGSDTDRANAYTTIGQGAGKQLSMSEYGTGAQGSNILAALRLSNQVLDDEQHLHPQSWVAWQAVNEPGDTADSLWGLAYRNSNNTITYPSRYYAMGNYSKFVTEGYKMIGNSDGNSFTAYNPIAHSLVIVTTNNATSSTNVSYNLSNFSSVGSSATPYQTSASKNLAQQSNISVANKGFSASLPAQSITTFVVPNVTYSTSSTNYYTIVNRNSGIVLDVNGASKSTGAQVIQWGNSRRNNQAWNLVPVSGGYYTIINRNSGLALDVTSASKSSGAAVIQWTSNNATNQQWSLVPLDGGYYSIVNRNSGLVLDVSQGTNAAGATVIQYSNHTAINQQWRIDQF